MVARANHAKAAKPAAAPRRRSAHADADTPVPSPATSARKQPRRTAPATKAAARATARTTATTAATTAAAPAPALAADRAGGLRVVPGGRATLSVSADAPEVFAPDATVHRLVAVLGNNGLARLLGVSPSQPTRWRSGKESISPANRRRLSDLDHVLDRLLLELWPDQAGDWLTNPNPHLGGAVPVDVLILRGAPPVLAAIDALAAGAFA